jgi:hypothetical protein
MLQELGIVSSLLLLSSASHDDEGAHTHLPETLLCDADSHTTTSFVLPAPGGAPTTISLTNTTACAIAGRGRTDRCCLVAAGGTGVQGSDSQVLTCDPHGLGCMTLGACATAPKFSWGTEADADHLVAVINGQKWCMDAFGDGPDRALGEGATAPIPRDFSVPVQLYHCVSVDNQRWLADSTGRLTLQNKKTSGVFLGLLTDSGCKAHRGVPVNPTPSQPGQYPKELCPQLHYSAQNGFHDPSGPQYIKETETWHLLPDVAGGEGHAWSYDLVRSLRASALSVLRNLPVCFP